MDVNNTWAEDSLSLFFSPVLSLFLLLIPVLEPVVELEPEKEPEPNPDEPVNFTEHTDKTSGRTYWHNKVTKKSVWSRPPGWLSVLVPNCLLSLSPLLTSLVFLFLSLFIFFLSSSFPIYVWNFFHYCCRQKKKRSQSPRTTQPTARLLN